MSSFPEKENTDELGSLEFQGLPGHMKKGLHEWGNQKLVMEGEKDRDPEDIIWVPESDHL